MRLNDLPSPTETKSSPVPDQQVVLLLHGLAAHWVTMTRLGKYLQRDGYSVINWGYRSIWQSIDRHADRLAIKIRALEADPTVGGFHVVTHSMGSIVARAALLSAHPLKLGRVVMLGPPNAGSHVARRLARPLGWLCPPLRDLSDSADSYVNRLPEPESWEVGIIAASQDWVVNESATYLRRQGDWIRLPSYHGVLPWRKETARQVSAFLACGEFSR